MARYKGTVNYVKNNYGFISFASVTHMDGSSPDIDITKDVYVHGEDSKVPLKVGVELSFTVDRDWTRDGAHRAENVIPIGVELHFDPVVDHPMISISWCVMPEMLDFIGANMNEEWYLAIVAQERRDRDDAYSTNSAKTVFLAVRGVSGISDGRGYLTFRAPGTYDVVAYLVRSRDREDVLKKRLKKLRPSEIEIWSNWLDKELNTNDSSELGFLYSDCRRNDEVAAFYYMTVSVPEQIFAKPLKPTTRSWLAYFNLHKPKDECSVRRRLAFAFTLGPVLFVLWEFIKRLWMLFLGALFFVFGGDPRPVWKAATRSQLSAKLSTWRGEYEFDGMTEWRGWKRLLHPFPWISVAFLTWLWLAAPKTHHVMTVLGGVVVVIALFVLFVFIFGDSLGDHFRESREERARRAERQLLERVQTYAICGQAPAKKVKTVRLIYSELKRRVCRTYSG